MKLNKKGFTIIELLGAVSIMAILSGIAVASVTRYQEKARQEAYRAMEESTFSASQNYIQNTNIVITGLYEINDIEGTLVDAGYLPNLEDPRKKGSYCHTGSKVKITRVKGSGNTLDKYIYEVYIKCSQYESQRVECNTLPCTNSCSAAANVNICNKLAKKQKIASCPTGSNMCLESGIKFES